MTVLVVAPEEVTAPVADALSDRDVRVAITIADARDVLDAIEPTAVLVASRLPDGDGTALLDAVRSDENDPNPSDPPGPPVIELVGTGTDPAATSGSDASSDSGNVFDDRVEITDSIDGDAPGSGLGLAVAVNEYRTAADTFYERCRRNARDESIGRNALNEARETAGERLTAVQRAAGGRVPFDRIFE